MAATKGLDKVKKAENENSSEGQDKLGGKEYERELARLHGELDVSFQEVVHSGRTVNADVAKPQ